MSVGTLVKGRRSTRTERRRVALRLLPWGRAGTPAHATAAIEREREREREMYVYMYMYM
jgi:hypothetical protein